MGECSCRDKVMADGAINLEMLDFVMAGLMKDYFGNKDQIKELICEVGPDLNEKVAKCILYADCVCGNPEARNHRFSWGFSLKKIKQEEQTKPNPNTGKVEKWNGNWRSLEIDYHREKKLKMEVVRVPRKK